VGDSDRLDNGEPEPCPPVATGSSGIRSAEALEDVRQVISGKPRAAVSHLDDESVTDGSSL
jgi:hypothetical protein